MVQDDRAVACSHREVELDVQVQVRVHVNVVNVAKVGFHRIRHMNPNHVLLLE
jgi:hypothetical protein